MAKLSRKQKKMQAAARAAAEEQQQMFGPNMNFAATEAYKLLRTNLVFSFSGEPNHRVIGVTSSFHGEGKSLTAMNLAYTLAEAENRVLLIDGDMRLSNVARNLKLSVKPGLSNVLVGMSSVGNAVQECTVRLKDGDELSFDVIVAGEVPPNPSELLGSNRMQILLEKLKDMYDYILVDLPPIMEVADALVVTHIIDGMFIVVRKDSTTRSALSDVIRQLKLVNAHILGFVFNGASESGHGAYKKYYSSYYKSGR
ncbi:MAG: CpsD/CapB family tyrosine-protein kinase [Oscillospiraceae bacterium]|nr:CpsD/CapB family tyrosine-protein kinase [Oscillospiraceae bacterium]